MFGLFLVGFTWLGGLPYDHHRPVQTFPTLEACAAAGWEVLQKNDKVAFVCDRIQT